MDSKITYILQVGLIILFISSIATKSLNAQLSDATWIGLNEAGDTLTFMVAGDKITSIENVILYDSSSYTLNLTGKAVWLKNNVIQIIYWDKPREQGFVKYELDSNGNLRIKRNAFNNFLKSPTITLIKQ